MRTLAYLLPGLTCAGSMAACMWMMSRRARKATPGPLPDQDMANIHVELNEPRSRVAQTQDNSAQTTA